MTTATPTFDPTAIRAKFSLKHLLMAAAFRATKDIRRHYLCGIHVMPCRDGVDMFAIVEGQRLSVNHDFNSPQSSLEAFVSPGPCQVEGRFPDVFRVIPRFDKLKPHQAGPMNSEYFARIDAVNKLCRHGKYNGAIRLWSNSEEDDKLKTGAIVVQFDLAPEVLAVIMPMRSFDGLKFPAVARIDGLVTPPPAPAAAVAPVTP